MKSNNFYSLIIAVSLFASCAKSSNINSISASNLKKAVFTRANDSVVTSFKYDANGYVSSIEEIGGNMVGLSPTISRNGTIVFQRNASGLVTSYGIVYPSLLSVLTAPLNNFKPFYIANSNKLQYCIDTQALDSIVYIYTGSYITTSITYSKRFLSATQPIFKYEYTYDMVGNLLTSQYYVTNFVFPYNLTLLESLTFNGYDTNQNALQVLNHEESILALRPQYASPNNPLSENYAYATNGITSYTYTYSAGLPTSAIANSTGAMYSGTVRFYY